MFLRQEEISSNHGIFIKTQGNQTCDLSGFELISVKSRVFFRKTMMIER